MTSRPKHEDLENPAAVPVKVVFQSNECDHVFTTTEMLSSDPRATAVQYACPRCKRTHGFRQRAIYMVNSPNRTKRFAEFLARSNITDTEVEIRK